jgi:hypothetical protein
MKYALATMVAFSTLASSLAAQETPIQGVDVEFELQDVESKVASEFWADLEGDLEAEIIKLVANRIAEDGSDISIDIDEFDVSKTFQGAIGVDSVLTGAVEVKNEGDTTKNSFYDLRVSVDEAAKLKRDGDGADLITHDREDVYRAMVETFAEGVVKRLR